MSENTPVGVKFSAGNSAIIIAAFSIISRILGLIRDRLLAGHFGAGAILDSYYTAFKLPDFVFNIFVLGALSSAFIPVFIEARRQDHAAAWKTANAVLNILSVLMIILSVAGIIFADSIIRLIAPGFGPEQLVLTIKLSRVMMVATVFLAISNVFGGIVNSYQKFFTYSLAPVLYNVGIIFGLWLLVPLWGPTALAYGVLLGAMAHMLVQLPTVIKLGWRWTFGFGWKDIYLRKIIKLMVPRTLGLAVYSFNQLIITFFASMLTTGSLAAFSLAYNLQSFPINVFGVSLAIAVFPLFSEAYVNNNRGELIDHLVNSIKRVLFFTLPLGILFLVLRAQIIRIVLGSGNFNWSNTIMTANIFGLLALSLVAESLLPIIVRAFYAQHDTKTPVIVGLVGMASNIILATMLIKMYAINGLVLANVISTIINFSILVYILSERLGGIKSWSIVRSGLLILLASLPAGLAAYLSLHLLAPLVNMHTFIGISIQGIGSGLVAVVIYLLSAYYLKIPELAVVMNYLKSFFKKSRYVGFTH